MIDFELLLAAAAEEPPCGPNLEYDPDYRELEQMARGKEEKRTGDTVIPAEPPRWPEVQDKASALLLRSKDLRVACILVRAFVHVDGFAGFVSGIRLMDRLLEQYWDGVHPLLDVEDNNDPTMRLNALAPLANPLVLLRELRDATLVKSRQHGQVLVRDVETALNKLPPRAGTTPFTQAQLESVLAAAFAEDGAALPRVGDAIAAVTALSALLDSKVGSARAPDLKPLLSTLQTLAQVVHEPTAAEPENPPLDVGGNAQPITRAELIPSGEIRSRQDAMLMIDKIVQYLEANEPNSPAPMLLRRGKRFMTMSFVDIVKEISPDSIEKFNVIVGPHDGA